jgi:hypothetical protein
MKIYERKYIGDDNIEHIDTRTLISLNINCEHSTNENKKCEMMLICENMQSHNENENDDSYDIITHNVEIYEIEIDGCDMIMENDTNECIHSQFMDNVS